MDKQLKLLLKTSFALQEPKDSEIEKFVNSISYPKARFRQVLFSQIGYIRKRVWLLFALCVCFAFFYAEFLGVPENIVSGVSAILPFISLCIITEVYKSTAHNMEEVELSCKHNLPKIILMRLGILGAVSFAVLALLIAIVGKNDYGTLRNTVYIAVPYLLTSYISLLIVSNFRTKETLYICAAVSGAISIFALIANTNYKFIYNANLTFAWVICFAMLNGLLFFSLVKFTKLQEELA